MRCKLAGPSLTSAAATRREHSLLSLLELSNELGGSLDLFEVADLALFNLMGHFGVSRGALWVLPEEKGEEAVLLRAHGVAEPVARAVGAVWAKWLTRRMGGLSEPLIVAELGDLASVPGLQLAQECELAIFCPIHSRGRFLGLLALGKRVGGEKYGTLEIEVLQASVNLVGSALENNLLVNRVMENNRTLRLANEKHEELDRLKSEFLRNLNHELKTPLTIMIAYLDGLLGQEPEAGSRRPHLLQVREQTAKLQGMVLNLLDFSKLIRNELEVKVQRADLSVLVQAFHRDRRPGVAAGLRELRVACASQVPPGLCDPDRLFQVLDALVQNASKFTAPGAQILLRVDTTEADGRECVRIQVSDNGPGIPADRLPFIFDSFRQGDGSATRSQGGIGIGLALSKHIVAEMGGRLSVESEIGQGTTFTILLPI